MDGSINFITDNINELPIQDRKEILQILYNSNVKSKLKEKGGGTQIKISDLSNDIIKKIHDFIKKRLSEQQIKLY